LPEGALEGSMTLHEDHLGKTGYSSIIAAQENFERRLGLSDIFVDAEAEHGLLRSNFGIPPIYRDK